MTRTRNSTTLEEVEDISASSATYEYDTPEACLITMLTCISRNSINSHWYRLLDQPSDNPTSEARRLMEKEDLTNLDQFNELSLHRFVGVDNELYIWMLKKCELAREYTDKSLGISQRAKWENFFDTQCKIEADLDRCKPAKTPASRFYIRIGPKNHTTNWYTSIHKQTRDQKFTPPRCPGLEVVGPRLNSNLRRMYEEFMSKQKATVNSDTNKDNRTSNEVVIPPAAAAAGPPRVFVPPPKYPLIEHYGLGKIDNNRIKRLLGELIAKQREQTKSKNKLEYHQLQQSSTTTAVTLRSHATENAFERYHRSNPYLDDVISALDPNKEVGALRLSDYLAKHHQKQFISAAETISPAINRVLNGKKDKKAKKKKRKAIDAANNGDEKRPKSA